MNKVQPNFSLIIRSVMHSLFLREHELGGGGGLSSCDTQQPQKHLCSCFLFAVVDKVHRSST